MDIPLFIVLMALALAATVLVLFVVLVVAIRSQDRRRTFDGTPSNAEHLTRRLLGTYAHHCQHTTSTCSGRR